MTYVEWFWASWFMMFLWPIALMALLFVGMFLIGAIGVAIDRVREFLNEFLNESGR